MSWAPPATRATIFVFLEVQAACKKQAIDVWYVGPAPKYYTCYRISVPAMGKTRIVGQVTFYPEHGEMPKETPMDEAKQVACDLLKAIQCLQENDVKHKGRHSEALQALERLFKVHTYI